MLTTNIGLTEKGYFYEKEIDESGTRIYNGSYIADLDHAGSGLCCGKLYGNI